MTMYCFFKHKGHKYVAVEAPVDRDTPFAHGAAISVLDERLGRVCVYDQGLQDAAEQAHADWQKTSAYATVEILGAYDLRNYLQHIAQPDRARHAYRLKRWQLQELLTKTKREVWAEGRLHDPKGRTYWLKPIKS